MLSGVSQTDGETVTVSEFRPFCGADYSSPNGFFALEEIDSTPSGFSFARTYVLYIAEKFPDRQDPPAGGGFRKILVEWAHDAVLKGLIRSHPAGILPRRINGFSEFCFFTQFGKGSKDPVSAVSYSGGK